MGTRIEKTDLARDALYEKVNQIADEKVSLENDETISGAKTFTQNLIRMNTNITKGTNPSSKTYCTVEFTDKNGAGVANRVGLVESAINTNGDIETLIGAYKYENDFNTVGKISVIYPKTGNPYTYAPAPTDTTTTSGTQIATTGWVNSVGNNVVHLAGNETITGDKTFTNNFIHYKTDIAYTETPSANKYGGFNFLDKNGTEIGAFYTGLYTSGAGLSGINLKNKSGNTATLGLRYNTSGTFYTEAPAPTDTTTTSGTQIATTGWVNSTNNNAVHKTGDETIAGNKTFSGNIKLAAQSGSPQSGLFISSDYTTYAVSVQDTKITKGTAPSSNSYCGIDFYGTATTNYANRLGLLEFRYETNKLTSASLCAFKSNAASDSVSARVAVYYPPTGNPYTEAPASDANNSIVTTVGKNKAQNGYFKLGNGLIIQWGRFTVASGKTSATITFPTAFTSTNYSINCMQNNKNGGYQYDGVTGVTSRNTANCTVYTFYDSTGYDWIAIGY